MDSTTITEPETDEWGDPVAPTAAELEMLRAIQQQHEGKRGEKPAEALVEILTPGIDRMLAEAEDEHEQAELPGGIADPSEPQVNRARLLTAHGWPKRYVDPIEPEGGEWKAGFALMLPVIESGGIGLLHGKRGNGKTRMAAEIARMARFPHDVAKGKGPAGASQDPKRTPLYRTAMEFFVDVRSTYNKASETTEKKLIEHLASVGLLVIDELQERGESAFEDRLLTHLIDRRYGAMLPTILIANLTLEELTRQLGPSIVDRYRECGRRLEFTWDSYRGTKR
jgi:hypothetical protein